MLAALLPAAPAQAQQCAGRFFKHILPHTTRSRGDVVRFYESNGSGVAIDDLNADGLLDIVLGNLDGPNHILWNRGGLVFDAEAMDAASARTRAVQIVDADADGWPDILLTSQTGSMQFWRSNHDETFTRTPLPGVLRPAYTFAWADVDADGDLDLITASYDAELQQLLRDSFLNSEGAGVYYYQNDGGRFTPVRLASEAQALAVWVSDLDGDGSTDLIVGNDFSLPDAAWSFREGGWQPAQLFDALPFSTMSFDAGDIDNDGQMEFFAADMLPTDDSAETEAAWRYVLADIAASPRLPGDLQASQNMLYVPRETPGGAPLVNRSAEYGVAATGWTWSSLFGDLDNDGDLDLYAVNGMAARELFSHLPHDSLIERNIALRSENGRRFTPAPEWSLGSMSGGRGMSMGDLDNDGDLDIVINNLDAPAQLFENRLCGGASLQVELRWPGAGNTAGLGARLVLHTSAGVFTREIHSGRGYLSGGPARAHFGFPAGTQLQRLEVYWADGLHTEVRQFSSAVPLIVRR